MAALGFIDRGSLLGASWRFSRGDGSLIRSHLRFHQDGSIIDRPHANESMWRLEADSLLFLHETGQVTSTFDTVEITENKGRKLLGSYNFDQSIIHVLEEEIQPPTGRPWGTRPRVAVLVRTHLLNHKLLSLYNMLRSSPAFDTYILADETRGIIPLSRQDVISHTIEMCQDIGLAPEERGNYLWHFGDYPIYIAQRLLPQYDYYFQIEYDVQLTRNTPFYIEALINRIISHDNKPLDFFGVGLGIAGDAWGHAPMARNYFQDVYMTFFPFVGLSARAVNFLYEWRKREAKDRPDGVDYLHCEAFVGSALIADGSFHWAELNSIIPNSCRRATFRVGLPMLLGDEVLEDAELLHPVFDAAAYLQKHGLETA